MTTYDRRSMSDVPFVELVQSAAQGLLMGADQDVIAGALVDKLGSELGYLVFKAAEVYSRTYQAPRAPATTVRDLPAVKKP